MIDGHRIVAITGGIGGAKLALGLVNVLGPEQLAFVANTGDDFDHLGLHISPDIDTLVYTLAGLANEETGWGRRGESWQFLEALSRLGGESWFALGDKDLAMHVQRTRFLGEGHSLTEVTRRLAAALGIEFPVFPMCDQELRTKVKTAEGLLDFQTYFVREKCKPVVEGFVFAGRAESSMNDELLAWVDERPLTGILLCPSNPYVSIDPILNVSGMRQFLKSARVPVIAVSPVVGGKAIKGPTVKMMQELGIPRTVESIAEHYEDFLDGLILDTADKSQVRPLRERGVESMVTSTVMRSLDDRLSLAQACLSFVDQLSRR